MCGICGVFDPHGRLSPIVEMNRLQRHRGPDDEGYLFVNSIKGSVIPASGADTPPAIHLIHHRSVDPSHFDLVLASRRLAILDLSTAGHMPMSYLGGRLWLTYNGEIYNYRELRNELKESGFTFASDTDTEIILAAYAQWGFECLSHFNGMFAFALWDGRLRRLFCARDRLGVKPFYYYWNGSTFVFASEIKSVLCHSAVPQEPNDQAIFDYLARGQSDHSDETFFQNIHCLPPGHYLAVNIRDRQLIKKRWWKLEINPSLEVQANDNQEQVYGEFADLLEDSVRLRLRSDVTVGSCLSGGLDSSSIVRLANRLLLNEQVIPNHLVGEHQKTFTARNKEAEIDEYKFSHLLIEQTGAEENVVFPNGKTLWKEIESFVWHMDEPVDSASQYPQWNVMRLARQRGVIVLLDGQGGDEILAGYYTYLPAYLSQVRQQRGLIATMQAGWNLSRVGGTPVTDTLWLHASHHLPWRLKKILTLVKLPRALPGTGGSTLKDWQLPSEFMQKHWDRRWMPPKPIDENGLAGILHRDLTSTNLPKLLRYEDRNSMAFSLETRLPFLDYRLVEKVFSLPLSYRIREGWNKWILRRSLSHILPQEICWRRSKLGFPIPEVSWLRQGGAYIRQLLRACDTDQIAAYIRPGVLRSMQEQSDEELAATPGLWRMTNLVIWLDLFFNKSKQEAPTDLSSHETCLNRVART
jgi:asparagine synthase (glutamine-hydrolysing)